MKSTLTEDQIEQYNLQLLQNLGYNFTNGFDILLGVNARGFPNLTIWVSVSSHLP
jgi:hypothetical protein